MRSLDTHLSQISWRYQVKAELARFYKLDIAVAAVTGRALASYLLLSGHDSGVVTRASGARLAMLHVTHGALLVLPALHLRDHLVLACYSSKYVVSKLGDN